MAISGRMGVLFHVFLTLKVNGYRYVYAYISTERKETHVCFVLQVMLSLNIVFGGSAHIAGDCISRRCEPV